MSSTSFLMMWSLWKPCLVFWVENGLRGLEEPCLPRSEVVMWRCEPVGSCQLVASGNDEGSRAS